MAELAPRVGAREAGIRRLARVGADLWYLLWWIFLTAFCRIAFRLKITGREHEPRHGPVIAALNHTSAIDPILAGVALKRRAAYMGKAEVFTVPILSAWVRSLGAFPVRRGEPDRKALRHASNVLEEGRVLVMFPEGTRSPDGRLQTAEPGSALLALRTGSPILPIALIGAHRVLPKGSRRLTFVPVQIRIGPALTVPRIEGRIESEILEQWGERIISAIGKLLPPDQGGTWVEVD